MNWNDSFWVLIDGRSITCLTLPTELNKTMKYFITATGTEIGKTYLCCEMIKYLRNRGDKVRAIKPVISGFDINRKDYDLDADNVKILESLGLTLNKKNLEEVSPFSFPYPASPDIAARYDNLPYVDYDWLLAYCKKFLADSNDYAFIEGVGGIMVPLNKDKLILDLIKDLNISVILVAGNYLGTLSHTLSALKVLERDNIKVNQLVVKDINNDDVTLKQNLDSLNNFYNGTISSLKLDTLERVVGRL